jgi:hypothetical protein
MIYEKEVCENPIALFFDRFDSQTMTHPWTPLILMSVLCSIWLLRLPELITFVEGKDEDLLGLVHPKFFSFYVS